MKYYKSITDGYINYISTSSGPIEISEGEYMAIAEAAQNKPKAPAGFLPKLKDDLDWEIVKEPESPETTEDKAEAYDILMGVSE